MTYVISDIHGNKKAFDSIMKKIKLKKNDKLYILGDVIDRYNHGIEILQQIITMPNVHMILGNHEYMMMDALGFPYEPDGCTANKSVDSKMLLWFKNGGMATYEAWLQLSDIEQSKIKKYLLNLPLSYDIIINNQRFILVHATWDRIYKIAQRRFHDQSKAYFSVWDRTTIGSLANFDEFITIFGHTITCNFNDTLPYKIYTNGTIIGIDCGAGIPNYGENSQGRLACIQLETMEVLYSN